LKDSSDGEANQKPETRNQKPETRNQKPETRNRQTRNQKAGLADSLPASCFLLSGFWFLVSGLGLVSGLDSGGRFASA
jgi:hypothetical protein